jgi:glucokinase-like ROK family protein
MTGPAAERPDSLYTVLDLIRGGVSRTRPELVGHSGLGRKVVTQRVEQLIACGLVEDGELGRSTGGRAPRQLRFRVDGGILLVAELGYTSISVGLTDLAGRLLDHQEEPAEINAGPEKCLDRVEELFDGMLARRAAESPRPWGVGMGVLGPVNAATGRPVALPLMPGWADYPVRDRLATRYDVPVWVDNEVNLMALGELRGGLGRREQEVVFIKIGSGIGAGLISAGRLVRGALGAAGEIGHITVTDDDSIQCWCGKTGCLVQVAGGDALARAGASAADSGRSPWLAARRSTGHRIDAADIAAAAADGDPASIELLARAGRLVGRAAATVVNTLNPSLIIIGGGVAAAGDMLLAAIRQGVYRHSLPLSTRDLRIAFSPLSDRAGLAGAAAMVIDQLLSREHLGQWIDNGSPTGRADLIHKPPDRP